MNPIEILYPLFKLQNSTDTRLYLVIIGTLLLFNLYMLKRMSGTESEMKAFVGFLITIWHGIKEVYDLYQVEEIYKVEPDLEKYQDEKTLNKVLDK